MLWFLAYAILAIRVCSGLQPGGGDGTSTLTTLSTGRTTVTDTASEIFESAAPTSTTYSLDLTTITAASSSPFIVTVSPTTVWSAILEIPTTNNLGQSITVTEISTHSSFYDPSPPTHGTTSKPPISTNSVFSSEIWITTTNSLGETIITWHWEISTITFE